MEMAERFGLPVLSLADSAGAYPGIGAEERGQAEAIARSTDACMALTVPNVAIITGEGMSGGAIAITTANKVLMLEHAIYSVISPEAASSILWRDGTKAQEAANNMKITAQDMLRFGVIDSILKEPVGGAHRDPAAMIATTGDAIAKAFDELRGTWTATPSASSGGRNSSISAGNWADSAVFGCRRVGKAKRAHHSKRYGQRDGGHGALRLCPTRPFGRPPDRPGNPALTLFLPKSAISVRIGPEGPSTAQSRVQFSLSLTMPTGPTGS